MVNFQFIKADGTQITKSFSVQPVNYPKISGNYIVSGDAITSSNAPASLNLVGNNIYKVENNLSATHPNTWYISSSASTFTVISGSNISSSMCATTFNLEDIITNPLSIDMVEIAPINKNVVWSGSFVLYSPLVYTTDSTGSFVVSLVQQPYEITLKGIHRDTVFQILPSGSSCNAKDVIVTDSFVSNHITVKSSANYAYTADASDARYARSGSSGGSSVSCSYANTASYADTSSVSHGISYPNNTATISAAALLITSSIGGTQIKSDSQIYISNDPVLQGFSTRDIVVIADLDLELKATNGNVKLHGTNVSTIADSAITMQSTDNTTITSNDALILGGQGISILAGTDGLTIGQNVADTSTIFFDGVTGIITIDSPDDFNINATTFINQSLTVNAPVTINEQLIATGITSSLKGTASFAKSASIAINALFASASVFATQSLNATSSISASYVSGSYGIVNQFTASSIKTGNIVNDSTLTLNTSNEGSISIASDGAMNFTTNNEHAITITSDGGISLNSNNGNDVTITSAANITANASNGVTINGGTGGLTIGQNAADTTTMFFDGVTGDLTLSSADGIFDVECNAIFNGFSTFTNPVLITSTLSATGSLNGTATSSSYATSSYNGAFAWANFGVNGTTLTTNASRNLTLTRMSGGLYGCKFNTPATNVFYMVMFNGITGSTAAVAAAQPTSSMGAVLGNQGTTAFTMSVCTATSAIVRADCWSGSIAVFGF